MPGFLLPVTRCCVLPLLLIFQTVAFASDVRKEPDLLAQGIALREQGHLDKSIQLLTTLSQTSAEVQFKSVALSELGATQIQAHHYAQAEANLRQALSAASDDTKARPAFYLGNLAAIRKSPEEARHYYQEALRSTSGDGDFRLAASLNLARLADPAEQLEQLTALSSELARRPNGGPVTRYHLNLGEQARRLGSKGLFLAFSHLQEADRLARQFGESRLQLEALDALGQLYEDQQQLVDAIALTRRGLALARTHDALNVADLMINLEWRLGRLLQASGQHDAALAAYRRAVHQVELVRQDMPIDDHEGRSVFQVTLEPLLLAYADLALQQLDTRTPERQDSQLRQVIGAIELIRQSEMQDFLGDRCALEAVEGGTSRTPAQGTAILYPIALCGQGRTACRDR